MSIKINKSQLQAINIISKDKTMPLLNNLHITKNGDVVCANGQALVLVEKRKKENELDKAVTIDAESIKKVLKLMPTDSLLKGGKNIAEVEIDKDKASFKFREGLNDRTIECDVYSHDYIDVNQHFSRVNKKPILSSVEVNLNRFKSIFDTLKKMYQDRSGELTINIDFTETEMILKTRHPKTSDNIYCTMRLTDNKSIEKNKKKLVRRRKNEK